MDIKTPEEFKREKEECDRIEQQAKYKRIEWLKQKYAVWPGYFQQDVKEACKMIALKGIRVVRVDIKKELIHSDQHLGGFNKNSVCNKELKEIFVGTWDDFLGVNDIAKTLYSKGYMLWKADNREQYASLYANRVYFVTLSNQLPNVKEVIYQEVDLSLRLVCQDHEKVSNMLASFSAKIREHHEKLIAQIEADSKSNKCCIL